MKKIGIIGAMELEVETLKAHMTTTKITTKAHMEFHEGTLNGTFKDTETEISHSSSGSKYWF